MACYESPQLREGQTWSSYLTNITLHNVIDTNNAEITVLPYRGIPDRFIIVQGQTYNYDQAERPFSLISPIIYKGTIMPDIAEFRACDIEAAPDEPPTDILGMIIYVKDKVIEVITNITSMGLTLVSITGLITLAQIKIDELKTMWGILHTNLNYELDVLEIWFEEQIDFIIQSIALKLELYNKDITTAIESIELPNLDEKFSQLHSEIVQLGQTISSKVITDLWQYIEDQIFEKE